MTHSTLPAPVPAPVPTPTPPPAPTSGRATDPEPVIVAALVVAGHDGQAELVVRVRFENGSIGSVTLNALFARELMEACRVESAEQLIGQPCQRLFSLMPNPTRDSHRNQEK